MIFHLVILSGMAYLNGLMTATAPQRESAFASALFIYMAAVVVLITLIPFRFRMPAGFRITWSTDVRDLITNVILFLPIGFLFRLGRRRKKDRFGLKTLGVGMLLSSAVEFTQFFLPGRYPGVIDVLTNGLGAWLGALVFVLLGKSRENDAIRLFTFELPLMNLAYLLIPLMWLNGLSTGGEAARLCLLMLLGLFGCSVLSSIYVHRLKQGGSLTPNKFSLFAACWFLVASLPALANFPAEMIGCAIIMGGLVQIPARLPLRNRRGERRFELPTLKVLLPLYAVYLMLLALWPTTVPFQDWEFKMRFQELTFNERIVFIFRFIEMIGAFTLFGYMIAEMRGRKKESLKAALAWVFLIVLVCSGAIETARAYPPLLGSDLLEILLMTGAGLYGGMIYRLQLAGIRQL
jgi:glycopeptide antibiotics resistance protein